MPIVFEAGVERLVNVSAKEVGKCVAGLKDGGSYNEPGDMIHVRDMEGRILGVGYAMLLEPEIEILDPGSNGAGSGARVIGRLNLIPRLDKPLPETEGRGICYCVTDARITLYTRTEIQELGLDARRFLFGLA